MRGGARVLRAAGEGGAAIAGEGGAAIVHLLEGVARVDELVHAEEGGAAARVPLRPLGLQPYALVGVAEGAVVLLEGHVRRRAVRVEDVVLGVELDGLLEQVDGAAVVLLVERLDRALLRLERLALPRHLLGDRVHHLRWGGGRREGRCVGSRVTPCLVRV